MDRVVVVVVLLLALLSMGDEGRLLFEVVAALGVLKEVLGDEGLLDDGDDVLFLAGGEEPLLVLGEPPLL